MNDKNMKKSSKKVISHQSKKLDATRGINQGLRESAGMTSSIPNDISLISNNVNNTDKKIKK